METIQKSSRWPCAISVLQLLTDMRKVHEPEFPNFKCPHMRITLQNKDDYRNMPRFYSTD